MQEGAEEAQEGEVEVVSYCSDSSVVDMYTELHEHAFSACASIEMMNRMPRAW